jgi:hypothetical protein
MKMSDKLIKTIRKHLTDLHFLGDLIHLQVY